MNRMIEAIEKAQSICLMGHMRPDGDCIGATLGLANYIRDNYPEKQVDVYLQEFDVEFNFLKGAEEVIHTAEADKVYDLAFGLDSSTEDRYAEFGKYFANAKYRFVIDHHASNEGFGDETIIVPDASATCEIIFTLLDEEKIGQGCAEALYTGIVHDTGVFKHGNTSPKTMMIAGKMLALGARSTEVIDRTFYSKSFMQNQILGEALLRAELMEEGKLIVSCLTKELFDAYHAKGGMDTDGIIDQLRVTRGIEVAFLMYEFGPNQYKVSLRSNRYVDVSKIGVHFGGGGHIRAAGCDISGTKEEVFTKVLTEIRKQL